MLSEEVEKKLMYDIRVRMAGVRTLLTAPELVDRCCDELDFLAKLMKDIDTEESIKSARYMYGLIKKAREGTYEIGD